LSLKIATSKLLLELSFLEDFPRRQVVLKHQVVRMTNSGDGDKRHARLGGNLAANLDLSVVTTLGSLKNKHPTTTTTTTMTMTKMRMRRQQTMPTITCCISGRSKDAAVSTNIPSTRKSTASAAAQRKQPLPP
jgi:hypothetical protein